MRHLVWFSCGAASAVVAKIVSMLHPEAEILYCNTLAYEHPDNKRFLRDVEQWIGKNITLLESEKYTDIFDVFNKTGWLMGVGGARCTTELKRKVRKAYQREGDIHYFGLTYDEQARIDRFEDDNPELYLDWVLATGRITKADCYRIIQQAGIKLPMMYKLGYNNNNCIGCVKGQAGYWNKIRIDFPEAFERMAKQERKMNVAICKSYAKKIELIDGTIIDNPEKKRIRIFLDQLHPDMGRALPLPDIECGALCINDDTAKAAAAHEVEDRLA